MGNDCCQVNGKSESVDLSKKNEELLRSSEKGFSKPVEVEDYQRPWSKNNSSKKNQTAVIVLNKDEEDLPEELLNRRLNGLSLRKIDTCHLDREMIANILKCKPSNEDNRLLLSHIVKVKAILPQATNPNEIYKIHIIPPNKSATGKLSQFSKKKLSLENDDRNRDEDLDFPDHQPITPDSPESNKPGAGRHMNTFVGVKKVTAKFTNLVVRRMRKLKSRH